MRIKTANVGDSILRNVARPLGSEEIASDRLRELIEHLREILADAQDVGRAAPQIQEYFELGFVSSYWSGSNEAEVMVK